jgi:cell division protein FtsX
MSILSDVWLFSLFLLKSMVYALTGAVVLGLLDAAMHHLWSNGNTTKQPYVWALGICFILGMFVQ